MRSIAISAVIVYLVLFSTPALASIEINSPKVIIEVNPNLELFGVVYILAFNGSEDFIIASKSYIKDVLEYFGPYKDHPAVEWIREIMPRNQPSYLKDHFIMDLAGNLATMPYLGNFSEDDLLLSEFYRQLSDFAKKSNFIQFYNSHRETYEKAVKPLREMIPEDFPKKFVEFFGYSYSEYRVELSYSLWIRGHVKYDLNSITCVMSVPNDPSYRIWILFHEFTHPYINPLVDSHSMLFRNLTYFVEEVQKEFPTITSRDPLHYASNYYWHELFTESFALYLISYYNLTVVKYLELSDFAIGYYLVDDIIREFRTFEKTKRPNETLSDYFPTLIKHLQELATPNNVTLYFRQKVPVTVFWFLDRGYATGRIIIVYGTQNPDEEGNKYDRKSALQLKDNLNEMFSEVYGISPTIIVKSDKELTDEDLKENIILVGGPVANNLTKSLQNKMPIKFVLNRTWGLKRDFNVVNKFSAFLFTSLKKLPVEELPVDAPIPQEYPLGVIEVIRNPWNEKNFVLIVAGVDRYSTRSLVTQVQGLLTSYIIVGDNYIEAGFYEI
ncbi:MAG: hypothetical protein PWQ92_606 [Thermococcaceae archaeon]|nr:hypothetical protein [Thermococcaceae archaeon]